MIKMKIDRNSTLTDFRIKDEVC